MRNAVLLVCMHQSESACEILDYVNMKMYIRQTVLLMCMHQTILTAENLTVTWGSPVFKWRGKKSHKPHFEPSNSELQAKIIHPPCNCRDCEAMHGFRPFFLSVLRGNGIWHLRSCCQIPFPLCSIKVTVHGCLKHAPLVLAFYLPICAR